MISIDEDRNHLILLKKYWQNCQPFSTISLPVPTEKHSLTKLISPHLPGKPLLVLMAGCHGEEPAPVLALSRNLKRLAQLTAKYQINLIIYPLINPWGYDRNCRYNRQGRNCNDNWCHRKVGATAKEVKIVKEDLKKLQPAIFASLHEDDQINNFYLFTFGERSFERPLLACSCKYFPTLRNKLLDSHDNFAQVDHGVVYSHHDGSAEDFAFHKGAIFSCCTETPSKSPLNQRVSCNLEIVEQLLKLTGKII